MQVFLVCILACQFNLELFFTDIFRLFNMKLLFSFILFITNIVTAQSQRYILLDENTKLAIENANVDFSNGNGTHTDKKGVFLVPKNIEFIKISYIGYESLEYKLTIKTDTIFLTPSTEALNEVNVVKEKRNYQQIFPKKGFNDLLLENWGSDGNTIANVLVKAIYIPNESKDVTKIISKIIIHPTDYTSVTLGEKNKYEKQKDQKYAPFKINLYTVDTIIGIPIKRIFEKDITVQLKEGEKHLTYELTLDQQINFPIEGIFIAISSFPKEYYEAISFKTGPAFKTIGISRESKFKVYEKSLAFYDDDNPNAKWFRDQYMWDRNNTYYVGLEVY